MAESIKVCIVDYGGGNISSVLNIFKAMEVDVCCSCEKALLDTATHIVLPGVGAFGKAMEQLGASGILDILSENVLVKKKPFLGICVGMQILAAEGFEHGHFRGLGWIPGTVDRIDSGGLILPHVGWNNIKIKRQDRMVEGMDDNVDFYYVHNYAFKAKDALNVIASCEYSQEFPAIIGKDNIYGVQFHPEKSQYAGIRLLNNFLRIRQ